jgi:CBS domain-containing protein
MIGRVGTRVVVTATEDEAVLTVARRMVDQDVGAVVVVTPLAQPVGIVTDRDIVKRVVVGQLSPSEVPVSAIMTREVQTVDEGAPLEEALRTMARTQTRRLVVTGQSFRVQGIVSLDDLLDLLASEAESVGRVVRGAIHGHACRESSPPVDEGVSRQSRGTRPGIVEP